MIKNILNRFGFIPKSELEYAKTKAKEKEEETSKRILELQLEVSKNKHDRQFISVDQVEPIPKNSEARKLYVGQVAGFHNDILGPKIHSLIANVRGQLGKLDSTLSDNGGKLTSYSTKDFDLILKGTENALWLLYDWGEMMIAEQLEDQRPLSEEDKKELETIIT